MLKTTFKPLIKLFTLLSLLLFVLPSNANLFGSKPKFLLGEQAFIFSYQHENNYLNLNWQIAEGYYLYKKEIHIQPSNVELAEIPFPRSEPYNDEFFGTVDIYREQLTIPIPLKKIQPNAYVEVQYQGCTKGFCYPPETVKINLQAVSSQPLFAENEQHLTARSPRSNELKPESEQNQLASQLSANSFTIFWFFILGLGLAFTPCVLPMLPLLSAIVLGRQQRPSPLRAFTLSMAYVQGMALTYTLLGLIVAGVGLPFQIALQSPPVLITLSILFFILALSMFGLFTLELPHSWQQKLNHLSQAQKGGSYSGVFIMGMIAGLVASPCTSAPLSGALLYVAQSGNLVTGGLALYLLALGMGFPLILITQFGNKILPKSGEWLLKVKTLFGFVMLALPIFLLTRLIPSQYEPLLWSALVMSVLIWLNGQFNTDTIWKKVLKVALLIAFAFGAKPWTDVISNTTFNKEKETSAQFISIKTLNDLQQQITAHQGKKMMLDLYADWCVACKEFEQYTFSDPKVKTELNKFVALRIDMTQNSPESKELMQYFQILGLPTILFFDEKGTELHTARVTGFMQADKFLAYLKDLE